MSHEENSKPARVDRSRLLILGSLGAAAAGGGCYQSAKGVDKEALRRAEEEDVERQTARQREIERRQNLSTEEQLRMRQERLARTRPAAPPQMTTPSGTEGGGGGGGGGSH